MYLKYNISRYISFIIYLEKSERHIVYNRWSISLANKYLTSYLRLANNSYKITEGYFWPSTYICIHVLHQ